MRIMGCDVISRARIGTEGYRRFLTKTNLPILKVPVRMNGLTSSGMTGRCYFNVENLVEVFGGEVVLGWAVNIDCSVYPESNFEKVTTIVLFGHAMWLNTEGKLSDPTAKSWMTLKERNSDEWNFWRFMNEDEKVFVQFIPIKSVLIDEPLTPKTIGLQNVVDRNGETIEDWTAYEIVDNRLSKKIDWDEIDENISQRVLHDNGWGSGFSAKEASKRFRHKVGRFLEKSLATGKTLDEIREGKIRESIMIAKKEAKIFEDSF